MTETPRPDARLDALEIRIAHQDATIDELNTTVTQQWKQIDRLERQLKLLRERVEDVEDNAASGTTAPPANKPPPHY